MQILYDKNITDVEILSLAVGLTDDIEAVKNFNDKYTTPWHSGVDIDPYAIDTFGLVLTPTLMFFNPNGKMLFKNPGFAQLKVLEELIYRTTDIINTNIDETSNNSIAETTELKTSNSISTSLSVEDNDLSSSKNELPFDFDLLTILSTIIVILVSSRSIRKLKSRTQ